MSTPTYEHILLDIEGPVARLTMNRPERMNAMTNRMLHETTEAILLKALRHTSDAAGLLLHGVHHTACDLCVLATHVGRSTLQHIKKSHFVSPGLVL